MICIVYFGLVFGQIEPLVRVLKENVSGRTRMEGSLCFTGLVMVVLVFSRALSLLVEVEIH